MRAAGIFIITGQVQEGKTTFLTKLSKLLEIRGLKIDGFLCPGGFDAGQRSAFSLKHIGTGEEVPMASVLETSEWMKYRRFWFNPDAFNVGREWIRECLNQDTQVIVIDEVGPMELEGSGWSELLDDLVNASLPVQLWSVRENLLQEVMKRWNIDSDHLIRIDSTEVDQAANMVSRILENLEN